MNLLYHIGRYFVLMGKSLSRPEKHSIYLRQIFREMISLGFNSIGITVIISFFMGAVVTLQSAYNLESPFIPTYLIGLGARDSMILEFSSTVVGLILAGKVGSNIASEIGTMRVSEQIDAMEIMGINSASYLILPKLIAAIFFNPMLTIISIFIGIFGGWLAAAATGAVDPSDFAYGLTYAFNPYYVVYTLVKTVAFAFLMVSVSAYHGYYVKGGALEVGRASTQAVVYSSVLILMSNLLITHLMLT